MSYHYFTRNGRIKGETLTTVRAPHHPRRLRTEKSLVSIEAFVCAVERTWKTGFYSTLIRSRTASNFFSPIPETSMRSSIFWKGHCSR